MFDKARYLTSGVREKIPLILQMLLWNCIDRKIDKKLPLDYLQIFKLEALKDENGEIKQKIIHSQEQPEITDTYLMESNDPVTMKIYAIDDGNHSTMLLADEY